jgi:hypothetical protein
MKLSLQLLMAVLAALAALARVDASTPTLYDIENVPAAGAAWMTVIAGRTIVAQYDFNTLDDFGLGQQ